MTAGRSILQSSRLQLLEAPGGDGIFNPDGTVNVVVIRPCDGRGPGGRVYSGEMLARHAHTFSGLPSYLNHEDPKARKASGKIRRGPDELAGELRECRWQPGYVGPDDGQFGYKPGAVVGKFMPGSDLVESLLRRIPGQLKLSINSQATGVRPWRRQDGSQGWLVEGIDNDPENSSVDLVTAAGAGGRVAALIESPEPTSARRRAMKTAEAAPMGSVNDWLGKRKQGLAAERQAMTPVPYPIGSRPPSVAQLQEAAASRPPREGPMDGVLDYIKRRQEERLRRG